MTVLDTIRELQQSDEGTARVLLEMALYEAVCKEADRVRPDLERDVAKVMVEKASQGLIHLARQPVSKSSLELADQLVDMVAIAKADGDPVWDARAHPRDPDSGEFVPKNGKVRQFIANALGIATAQNPDKDLGDATSSALGSWVGPSSDKYSRMRSMGRGLVATNDPNARPAGTVLRLIGDIGPEAQRALEPGIRRTAYRYRGTERRPSAAAQTDAALVSNYVDGDVNDLPEGAQRRLVALQREVRLRVDQDAKSVAGMKGGGRKERLDPAAAALVTVHATPGSKDQKRLTGLSTFGVASLVDQVPDKDTAAISLAAGKMPPSVGMMFDGRGRLVSEAQGFNGDHYLPFDLRNLKRLKGGSYVRTRTTGGLTDEDVYTGLMTGARHMTVVSNSGVFTLEFDPDMRGGRRYSDKARQMVDRYARLVGAIGSGELYQNKMPRAEEVKIREESLKAAGGNAEAALPIFRRKMREAQEKASFLGPDDDDLTRQAEANVKAQPNGHGTYASQVKEEFTRLRAEEDKKTARKYRLDGEGYKAALKALKTEFPYYVRAATYTPLQEYLDERKLTTPEDPRRPRGGADMGYTPRGELSPDKAGVTDPKDPEHRRRIILGAPRGQSRTEAGAKDDEKPKVGADGKPVVGGAGGGGGNGSTGTTPKLDEQVKAARKAAVAPLYAAISESLTARTKEFGESWMEPLMTKEGPNGETVPNTIQDALGMPDEQFAKWYYNKHDGDWAKVAQALPDEPPAVLDKWLGASRAVKAIVDRGKSEGSQGWDNSEQAFKSFDDNVRRLKLLSKPFAEGPVDLTAEPPVGQTDPQAIPEITSIEPTPEKLTEWTGREGNQRAGEIAAAWQQAMQREKDPITDADIRREIANDAARIKMLKQVARGESPYGIDAKDEKVIAEAKDMEDQDGKSPQEQELADKHRAWALLRMSQVIGATRGTGAAVPLARPGTPEIEGPKEGTAKRHSTPSRLVVHRPGSPVAKALHQALAPQVRPLHRVRL